MVKVRAYKAKQKGLSNLIKGEIDWGLTNEPNYHASNEFMFPVHGQNRNAPQPSVTLSQAQLDIPNNWILVDNQSTCNIFCNRKGLKISGMLRDQCDCQLKLDK